jgi:hypothetical protein
LHELELLFTVTVWPLQVGAQRLTPQLNTVWVHASLPLQLSEQGPSPHVMVAPRQNSLPPAGPQLT